ncbi:Rne/Rng family ribonuclease [Rhodovulum sulfidophilum]|uniref:Rne/Rng family ribonuclease n=1 Tax=Rhodovulum sulfidophilum TaxID=35806 RepID=UPI00192266D0|nr:Rne/Rng family ribonuclease [Rhodovulum sulfidophilum]MBL3561055.1 Rne/Rng family ribonuclease [Rhodovulum sulfidophilum]
MAKKMLIDATHAEETRVVVVDGNKVDEFDFETVNKRQLAGNIYLAKVTRVEPSLQAAFVDYGGNRHGFLAFSEIHPDYYQIPVADREALLAEERALAEEMDDDEGDSDKPKRRSRSRRKPRADKSASAASDSASGEDGAGRNADGAEDREDHVAPAASDDDAEPADAEPADGVPAEAAAETEAEDAAPAGDAEEDATDRAGKDDEPPTTVMAMAAHSDDPVETREPSAGIPGMDVVDLGDDEESEDPAEEDSSAETRKSSSRRRRRSPRKKTDEAEDTASSGDETGEDGPEEVHHDDQIESVAEEDVHEEIRPRKPRARRYKIQEVIKVRQIMLVQVVKEERGNKGAALTTYLSLAGRYCVLMPNTARGGGISRKITNAADRKKLKEIAAEMDVPEGAGLIIRTAGAKRTRSEVRRDYEYLQRLWEQIRELTLKSIAPAPIYEEGDLIKRSIRDLYSREIDEVLVEGEGGYRLAKDFMKMIMPSHAKNVKNYTDPMPLFARYQVESYLTSMFNPVVQLKSGGYLVIGVTEALVAIDVNSGRATKEGSIEETALKTNLEAAEEVARQLRLRDLAGLIVIDFIDMEERKNNAAVEKRIKDKLKTDRARIQVGRISGFGLLEMSRQRLRPGMIEATTQPCPHCHGTGLIRSDDNLALSILRQIEEEGVRGRSREVLLKAPIGIINFLMNQKREHVAQIEARYGLSVRVEADPFLISPDFSIERFKTATRAVPEVVSPVVSLDMSDMPDAVEEEDEEEAPVAAAAPAPAPEAEDKTSKKRRRRRRRKKPSQGGDDQGYEAGQDESDDADSDGDTDAEAPEAVTAEASNDAAPAEEKPAEEKPRRSRRSRSRGRKTERPEAGAEARAEEPVAPKAEEPAAVEAQGPAEAVAPAAAAPVEAPVVEDAAVEDVAVEAAEASPDTVELAAEAPVAEAAVEVEEKAAPEAEPAPKPETQPEPEPETAEASKDSAPKRQGWWSVGR